MNKDHIYIPHSDVEYLGFAITNATIESGERIWVGAGIEGRWRTSTEVRELAAALVQVADASRCAQRLKEICLQQHPRPA